ncbi:MAG: multiprotein bridging factor aMBF1 [Salinarchaeum sp.]
MVQCEMCGAETANPTTIKVEGAELQVCSDCAEFGTEVQTQESSSTSTKYSTSSSGSGNTGGGNTTSTTSSGSRSRRSDMFDAVDELAQDYDDRIRQARENHGLSQSDLANELNEKASLIRKVERGDTLPSDKLQQKLEQYFDISLSAGGGDEDTDWDSEVGPGNVTLGDVVERGE